MPPPWKDAERVRLITTLIEVLANRSSDPMAFLSQLLPSLPVENVLLTDWAEVAAAVNRLGLHGTVPRTTESTKSQFYKKRASMTGSEGAVASGKRKIGINGTKHGAGSDKRRRGDGGDVIEVIEAVERESESEDSIDDVARGVVEAQGEGENDFGDVAPEKVQVRVWISAKLHNAVVAAGEMLLVILCEHP